ncbi:hypothetical protein STTU_0248 [Streptomyces sp. Tu6071]|nr:hypothetical protein STTU_0248 [Streptomyces sp. Tu6071]
MRPDNQQHPQPRHRHRRTGRHPHGLPALRGPRREAADPLHPGPRAPPEPAHRRQLLHRDQVVPHRAASAEPDHAGSGGGVLHRERHARGHRRDGPARGDRRGPGGHHLRRARSERLRPARPRRLQLGGQPQVRPARRLRQELADAQQRLDLPGHAHRPRQRLPEPGQDVLAVLALGGQVTRALPAATLARPRPLVTRRQTRIPFRLPAPSARPRKSGKEILRERLLRAEVTRP